MLKPKCWQIIQLWIESSSESLVFFFIFTFCWIYFHFPRFLVFWKKNNGWFQNDPKICSPAGDTDYFDIVAAVLQTDTLASYLFIICLDYVLRMSIDLMKENDFKLAKARSRRYPAQIIMDVDYADVIADGKYTCPSQIPAT